MRGLSPKAVAAAAVGAACLVLPVFAAASHGPLASTAAAARLANTATFEDSTGEDSAGPDIASVVVSNNDAGQVAFRINMPNRPTLTSDMIVDVLADTDNNPSSGDPDSLGAEYAIELFQGTVNLFRWDGSRFSQSGGVPQTSLIYSYANGALTFKISAAELGDTKTFKFGITAVSGVVFNPNSGDIDFSNAHVDLAPDANHGFWSYQVKLAPLRLVVKKFSESPRRPAAGKAFSAFLVAARSDTGAVLKGGRVTCAATVGGRRLTARTHAVVNGRVTCTWTIPASARGQTIRGTITVVFEGLTARKSFSVRVS